MRETLTTERLLLRPLRPADSGPITLFCSDFKVARMLARVPHPYPPGAAELFIERALSGALRETVYAIEVTQERWPDMVGVIGLREAREDGIRRLGYWLGPPAWGLGFATEAVRAVRDEAFADPALAGIEADFHADNPASGRVLKKAGFAPGETFEEFCPARGASAPAIRCRLDRARWARWADAAADRTEDAR